ncbi:MAG: type VII secretion protein EccCa [Nocardioides sp.]
MASSSRGRACRPELPTGELVISAPPEPVDGGGGLLTLVQLLGSLGSTALVATMVGSAAGGRWHAVLAGLLVAVALLGLVVVLVERRRHRARTVTRPRTAYLHYLDTVVATAREAATRQGSVLQSRHPAPAALPAVVEEGSLVWTGGDGLLVRYGVCDQPPSLRLVAPPADPLRPADPHLAGAVRRLLSVHEQQPDLPAVVDLTTCERVEVHGPTARARSLARAMVCSAAVRHAPEHLAVAVLTSPEDVDDWDWVKWLPHARSSRVSDAVGARRLVATDAVELARLLPTDRHLLLVVDGEVEPVRGATSRTVLALPRRLRDEVLGLRLVLEPDAGSDLGRVPAMAEPVGEASHRCSADQCDLATAEAMARRLAALACPGVGGERAQHAGLQHLLGLDDVRRLDPARAWQPRPPDELLRVPLGTDVEGRPVLLDLKESALQGTGPHGLVIGATGSGKSELLRTLVLGLALTHSPEQLNLVLVDFKGGATFAGLSDLPQVSAVITNLADDLALVDRMQDALAGELVRRQEVLRAAGHLASAHELARARAAGADLAPLPSLLLVVDEFSELLATQPELVDLFVAIGRLGRSLGIHLLLASQRLEEGRLRGLESHLSYRVALRTFSAQESRAVLGTPDAYELPPVPGLGLLQAGAAAPVRFRAAYVSGPPPTPAAAAEPREILHWTVREVPLPGPVPSRDPGSLLDLAVDRLRGQGPSAHPVWLPPLDEPETLDLLMPDLAVDPALGLVSRRWRNPGGPTLPLGTVDLPREQRRDVLTVDLAGAGGHAAVVGAPRTGTSTVLRTLVAGVALTTTPVESQVYVIDLGGAFASYAGLPHVAGIGTRAEPDVVRRIVAEVTGIVDHRESLFADHGIDSVATYRRRRAEGGPDDGYGDLYVVVDGWGRLRPELEDVEEGLQRLAARGLAYGCHLLTSALRWADYRPAVRDLLGTRLELRLGDPADSEVDRRVAALVPRDRPGRGLVDGPRHVLAALPRLDGRSDAASLGEGVEHLVGLVADAWTGPAAPRLRLLPGLLTVDDLLARSDASDRSSGRLLLGVDEDDLASVGLDPAADPHWLVLGDGGSGKSTALRGYLHEVVRTRSPSRAQVVLVDHRRSLLDAVPAPYLFHHLTNAAQAVPAMADLATHLEGRLAVGRAGWASGGAEVFVVVDDHDLVTTGHHSPLLALQPLLAQAGDVGLHLVVARRSGGAARALYEPVLQTLRDLAAPALLLSGSPEEGPLVGGVRPVPAPPGRGRLVTRSRGVQVVQLAWRPPSV